MSTEIARHWRLNAQRYKLVGEVCPNCQGKIFPPRDVCPHCAQEASQPPFQFSGRGEVYSYTTVHNPPEGYEEGAPYTVALVKLEEGPLITAQLTDVANSAVEIGMPVEMTTRKLYTQGEEGLIIYGYKFRPQLARA
ncbi:MAG: Zn-ribbon domain-containing OB-fold protein [Anaerolineae bacterium]|nr:Zn-ribbon domain-containing OB-fold protein [Anaerolineae bacterium]